VCEEIAVSRTTEPPKQLLCINLVEDMIWGLCIQHVHITHTILTTDYIDST
jgi:hypothetical protein